MPFSCPEWQIWAHKFETSLIARTEAIAETTTLIANLECRIKDLADNSSQLQAENQSLRERILRFEQDAAEQNQINCVNDSVQEGIRKKMGTLEREFGSVVSAVGRMQRLGRTEREDTIREIGELKAQIGNRQQSIGDGKMMEPRSTMRSISQVTTTDGSIYADQNPNTQLFTQYTNLSQPAIDLQDINIAPQGSSTLEEYLKYGDVAVMDSVKSHEARAVKAFVDGIAAKYRRKVLWDRLQKNGWTWVNAKEEIYVMVKEGKRRLRSRR